MNIREYNKLLDLVKSIDDIDGLLLAALTKDDNSLQIKISDENGEESVPYAMFLKMFDEQGLAAFC